MKILMLSLEAVQDANIQIKCAGMTDREASKLVKGVPQQPRGECFFDELRASLTLCYKVEQY